MQITFKLFASLTDYLPATRKDNAVALDITPGTTIEDVVRRFQVPAKQVHLVLINGVYIPPLERSSRAMNEGEVLAIWPPVAGG
jgi:molybdopterin synthase sulfur carrier subunit